MPESPWLTDRRTFLSLTAQAVAAAMILPACDGDDGDSDAGPNVPDVDLGTGDTAELAPAVEAYFGDALPSAKTIGTQWAQRFGDDDDALLAELDLLADVAGEFGTPSEGVERFVDGVHEDFESLRLVGVSGWQISETEARLCGFAAVALG